MNTVVLLSLIYLWYLKITSLLKQQLKLFFMKEKTESHKLLSAGSMSAKMAAAPLADKNL